MIRRLPACVQGVAVALFATSALFAQSEFSAEVANTQDSSSQAPARIFVTRDRMRVEDPRQGKMGALIVNFATQTSMVLIPERKIYMEMPQGHGMQRGFSFFRPADVENACTEWQKLATTPGGSCQKIGNETVNGRSAIKYEGKSAEGETSQVWIDPKLAFPIKWQGRSGGGELRSIKEGSQPADLFEIPAGFQKMDMGAMMGQAPPHP